ncbi:hypothetical protein [Geodermatophilus marinus]|uniref:hypothetical protein n=1 Tax=Geodermatophilus sp. LHW52908 TaxID=2303986 RepID=UPI000E3BB434|nr:hypothetical protein [Geodermatophilus sp. LHW52908]RFU21037.1 hypothetical protein D0Z06_13225 [Geodermatophilus sp. LHW52908]
MTPEELEAEFLRLTATGEMDKILRMLRARRDQLPREVVREILQEACLEVVKRQQAGGRITNVAGLLVTIGRRLVDKAWQQVGEGREVDEAFARRERETGAWQHDDAWHAAVERAMEYVFKAVANWPVDNHRRTLLLIIEAAGNGMQLTPRDLDANLGCAKGTGRVWRDRAYERLRAQIEADGMSWEAIADLLPGSQDTDLADHHHTEPDDDADEEEI